MLRNFIRTQDTRAESVSSSFFWQLQLIKLKFHCITQLHSQISVLFTAHTNAIVVPIKISIADLTRGAATQTFATGGKNRRAATAKY